MKWLDQGTLKEDRKKSKEELIRELIILRNKYGLQEQTIARYERLYNYQKSPDAVFEDLEDQKRAVEALKIELLEREEKLHTFNEELHIQNEELEVQNEEIRRRNAQLEKAKSDLNESESQAEMYLDLMCHDITNMNQIAMGYLELALETLELDNEGRELISKPIGMLENTSNLISNVKRLREMKKTGLHLYKVDVGQLLDNAVFTFANFPGRQITINKKYGKGCEVMANDLLKEVFINILGNAVKHSNGPLTINVLLEKTRERERERERAFCRLSIDDNGPGIPDGQKENAFNQFQMGMRNAHNRGLGLYIVKKLIEDLHGRVWVEDRVPGDHSQGARFIIMLPAAEK